MQCGAVERDNFNDCRIDMKCTFFPINICGGKKKKTFYVIDKCNRNLINDCNIIDETISSLKTYILIIGRY